jgi:hypothetical protein
MGLDVSHDAWHGAYSAFMRWRTKLAEVAGLPPLLFMEGFVEERIVESLQAFDAKVRAWAGSGGPSPEGDPALWGVLQAARSIPIRWEVLRPDPILVLLNHSDCEGEIAREHLIALADRLDELALQMPDEDGGGHVRNWRETTKRFADGCRRADTARENLDFH